MIKKIDEYIANYAVGDDLLDCDYWYDFASDSVINAINSLSDNEWDELITLIPTKSDNWKIRLAECLNGKKDDNYLKALLSMIDTDNTTLFRLVVSDLLKYDYDIIGEDNFNIIIDKINHFLPEADYIETRVFNLFLEKKNNNDVKLKNH